MDRESHRFVNGGTAAGFCVLLSVLLLAGCGGSAVVTGKVTAKGENVVESELEFEPMGESSEGNFYGLTDAKGTLLMDYKNAGGLPAGRYKITVTRFLQHNGDQLPAGEEGQTMKFDGRAIRHTFVFEKDIASGENAINFELSEGKFVPQKKAIE